MMNYIETMCNEVSYRDSIQFILIVNSDIIYFMSSIIQAKPYPIKHLYFIPILYCIRKNK